MSLGFLGSLIIAIVIAAFLIWIALKMVDQFGLPSPWSSMLKGLLGVVAFIIVVNVLLSLAGGPAFIITR